jgi:putative membrane protein
MTESKREMSLKSIILTAVNGALIGLANIIPGVSGGTFALILGIFDRMVNAINAISLQTLKSCLGLLTFRKEAVDNFKTELQRIDAVFLAILVVTAGISATALAFLMEYLLGQQTAPTLAFFVGLIVPSVAVPWAMMEKRGWRLLLVIPGIALTAGISFVMPDNSAGADSPLVAAGAGALAISAMILPGISGSFVLLVMGQYQNFIAKITDFLTSLADGKFELGAFIWLASFGIGLVVGLWAFTKVLALLLKKAKSATMAFLIGLILGSLFVLWPFKDVSQGATVTDRHGEVKQDVQIATAKNRMPESAGEGVVSGVALILGLGGSFGMIALGKRREDD